MKKLLLFAMSAAVALSSCSKDDTGAPIPTPEKNEVSFHLEGIKTRVAGTDFETDDEIGVQAYNADGSLLKYTTYKYVGNSTFESDDAISYEMVEGTDVPELSFVSTYPDLGGEQTSFTHVAEADQSDADNYEASDLLYAKVTPTTSLTPSLSFYHAMSCVVVNVNVVDEDGAAYDFSDVKFNASLSQDVNFETNVIKANATAESTKITPASSDDKYFALVASQSIAANGAFATVVIDNETITWENPKEMNFTSGYKYTYDWDIVVEDKVITQTVTQVNASINDWEDAVVDDATEDFGMLNIDGTLVLCEGNMSDSSGTLMYYDENCEEVQDIFGKANDGVAIGNVCQDLYIYDGDLFIITQNGDDTGSGGAGRFVVCDTEDMTMNFSDPFTFKTPNGDKTWPQHLVVTSSTQAFLQYAKAGEAESGICELEMTRNDEGVVTAVAVKQYLAGTYGAFTIDGATKARMVYSRGKIYAGCGEGVVVIDPKTSTAVRTATPNRQCKGVAKGADGQVYAALTGEYITKGDGYSSFTEYVEGSRPQIAVVNEDATVTDRVDFPGEDQMDLATWTPAVGMCASFTEPHIYIGDFFGFSATSATRYNYETDTFEMNYVPASESVGSGIYGIMGVHPTTNELWIGYSDYVSTLVKRFDTSASEITPVGDVYTYDSRNGASPAGVDFVYRFSQKWINK